jgi:hypothetical protein
MQIAPTGFPGRPRTYRDFGRNRPSLGSILGFIPTKLTRQIVGPQDHSSFTVNISFQLATSLERRQLRKPFCASPALARFHTAWTQGERNATAAKHSLSQPHYSRNRVAALEEAINARFNGQLLAGRSKRSILEPPLTNRLDSTFLPEREVPQPSRLRAHRAGRARC